MPQALGLVDDLGLADNVLLPARLRGTLAADGPRAEQLMSAFGLAHAGTDRRPDAAGWDELALVPQALGLVADLSLADNVLLPARLRRSLRAEQPRAAQLLEDFGLTALAGRLPAQASLGEQQRAAVARALLLRPALLLADEPTAHQDRGHADRLLDAVAEAAHRGSAVLVATHDEQAWERADRVLAMRDGRLVDRPPA